MTLPENTIPSEMTLLEVGPSSSNTYTLVEYVKMWGSSSSISLFEDNIELYRDPDIEGVVGYRLHSKCAIVFADPVCAPKDITDLTYSFHQFCKSQGYSVVYLAVSEAFAKWAINNICSSLVEVGEELIVDPCDTNKSASKRRALRNKVNLAQRAGITVKEYTSYDENLEEAMENVGSSWVEARHGPQIFLAQVRLFEERRGKRWFYATQGDKVVGVLLLQRLEIRQGWLVQFLMALPEAPNGTTEQLIFSTIQTLKTEECRYLTFGIAQIKDLGEIHGLGRVSEWVARFVFRSATKIFHLDRRRRYWRKFLPYAEPSYLLFSEPKIGLKEVRSILKALNVSI